MLKEVYNFLKKPVYTKDENTNITYRFSVFIKLLFWGLVFGIGIVMFNTLWEATGILANNEHALSKALKDMGLPMLVFLVVVVAPIFEELLFRGSLVLFKESKFFNIAFYVSIILFGLIHITNFEITATVLVLTPFLVAPQLILGVFTGFIRVKFGLGWSILLHASHNLILFIPLLIANLLDIPLE